MRSFPFKGLRNIPRIGRDAEHKPHWKEVAWPTIPEPGFGGNRV